ncbi:MAG TPA: DUF896 domain-containing protein [Bacillales bacterium]|nr:DUF896 domain-containing protein [Bacillales bacterium]
MLTRDKLNRINELSRKSKADGLSKKEKKEQQDLRNEYLQAFRKSFDRQLHSIKVVDPEGSDVTPDKLNKSKRKHKG